MKEREERQRQRERMLSELTAPTVAVANESQLREESGKNIWSTALVLMLGASTTPRLDREDRERLIKVIHNNLFLHTDFISIDLSISSKNFNRFYSNFMINYRNRFLTCFKSSKDYLSWKMPPPPAPLLQSHLLTHSPRPSYSSPPTRV